MRTQSPLWKPHHAADVRATLQAEIWPKFGEKPISAISAPEILAVLRSVQVRGAIELAHRLRQRISAVYAFAIASGTTTVNPVAGLERALMPVVRVSCRPAVLDLEGARAALRAAEDTPAHPITLLAHRLLVLTVLRPGELRFGRWPEIIEGRCCACRPHA